MRANTPKGNRHVRNRRALLQSPELEPHLGEYLSSMLVQMDDRGPDSAGVAVYRHPALEGWSKLTLYSAQAPDWDALAGELATVFGGADHIGGRAGHAVLLVAAGADETEAWIRLAHTELRVMSAGRVIEAIGLQRSDLPRLARLASSVSRLLRNSPRSLDSSALLAILEAAYEGELRSTHNAASVQ
jgi:hypothetical protein